MILTQAINHLQLEDRYYLIAKCKRKSMLCFIAASYALLQGSYLIFEKIPKRKPHLVSD